MTELACSDDAVKAFRSEEPHLCTCTFPVFVSTYKWGVTTSLIRPQIHLWSIDQSRKRITVPTRHVWRSSVAIRTSRSDARVWRQRHYQPVATFDCCSISPGLVSNDSHEMSQPRRTVFAVTVRFFDRQTQLGKSIGQGPISQRTLTVFELARGHGSVLATILQKPGRWVVTITIDSFHCARCGGEGSKYLQFMALEDKNSLLGECTSNAFLDEMHQLSTRQERALGTMGWHTPVPPRYPNWFFEVNTQSDLITLDAMTYRTLREVFRPSRP